MNQSTLRDLFSAMSAKYLVPVDADPEISHGHEIGGLSSMRECWGSIEDRKEIPARFVYLGANGEDPIEANGVLSWYNARRLDSDRGPEWRLYYKENDVTLAMKPGDFIVLAQMKSGNAFCAIAPAASSGEKRLITLFGIAEIGSFGHIEFEASNDNIPLDLESRYILESLGIEFDYEDYRLIGMLTDSFGDEFPTTRVFSRFSRDFAKRTKGVVPEATDADTLLLEWYETEELLFRTFEKKQIQARLENPFRTSDDFIDFAKSIMNRRSSRAGYALENHFEEILSLKGIKNSRGAVTENNSKPDFIFPSIESYRDGDFPSQLLTMLALKATCKDRWRQALPETERIEHKH